MMTIDSSTGKICDSENVAGTNLAYFLWQENDHQPKNKSRKRLVK